MTLGRFLLFFVVGLMAAWLLQWLWLYWILAIAAVWVVIQLLRG